MPPVYATAADLAAYTGTAAPADAAVKLTRASAIITNVTIGAVYTVDGTGLPTDAATLTAFRDATCAQVVWWAATGDPTGAQGRLASTTIGRVSLTFRTDTGPASSPRARTAPDALLILQNAGIIP